MIFSRPKRQLLISYNNDTLEFLIRNNLTLDEISKITENIISPSDIDSITEDISLFEEETNSRISIADIYGYEFPRKKDLFESFNEFFDRDSEGYRSRSVDMLLYDSDNIMEGLSRSFIVEPIKVKEISEKHYFIAGNGMHRFTILRAMYLIEKYRNQNKPGIEETLKDKYSFPAISKKLDKTKTYCAFLISVLDDSITIKSEIDENYHKTGRVIVKEKEQKLSLSDEELILYSNEIIIKSNLTLQALVQLSKHVEKNKSFYDFLNLYFSSLLSEVEKFIEFKKTCNSPMDWYKYKIPNKEEAETWTL